MFQKCHHHLHSLVEFESDIINQKMDEDRSLDIWKNDKDKWANKKSLSKEHSWFSSGFKWMAKISNVFSKG